MSCERCGGLMVKERFGDPDDTDAGFEGNRCLNCGSIEDPVIRVNRLHGRRSVCYGHLVWVKKTKDRVVRLQAPIRIRAI